MPEAICEHTAVPRRSELGYTGDGHTVPKALPDLPLTATLPDLGQDPTVPAGVPLLRLSSQLAVAGWSARSHLTWISDLWGRDTGEGDR